MIEYTWQDTFSVVAVAFFVSMAIPILWNQWKSKSSTIPLLASVQMIIPIAIIIPVFYSFDLLLGTALLVVQLMMWVGVAGQRIAYGGPLGLTGDRKLRR